MNAHAKSKIQPETLNHRSAEIVLKLAALRKILNDHHCQALRLCGSDWFSWVTGGGSNVVLMTSETGIAEVLITENRALILTTQIETLRLSEEEISNDFEILVGPWHDGSGFERLVEGECHDGARIMSDRPDGRRNYTAITPELGDLKLQMQPEEIERYRALGRQSAEAMTEALAKAQPDWTENRLAGEGARALWERGIHPALILVAGERRAEIHRHPFPTEARLGGRAFMVFCARRHGLFANLTRFVSFRSPTQNEMDRMQAVARIEASAFTASRPGRFLHDIYFDIKKAYVENGRGEESERQHFGGVTGYLSREAFARPLAQNEKPLLLKSSMALAWNPTLPGSKNEDTILINSQDVEVLTVDPQWPTFTIDGRKRPAVLERS